MDHAVAGLVKIREGLGSGLCPIRICCEETCPIRRIKNKNIKSNVNCRVSALEVCCGNNRAAGPVALVLKVSRALICGVAYSCGNNLCVVAGEAHSAVCSVACCCFLCNRERNLCSAEIVKDDSAVALEVDHAVAGLIQIREGLCGRLCPVGISCEEACPIRRIKYEYIKNYADRSLSFCEVCCGDNRAAGPVALILAVKRAIVAVYETCLFLCAER